MTNSKLHIVIGISIILLLTSCGVRAPHYDFRELAHAAVSLNMDIDLKDNHKLYIESAKWIGVPYRHGGSNKRGIDCSGLTCQIYQKVYHKKLKRSANEQRTKNCQRVTKRKLKEGDLVFFHNGKRKRTATHVGIYLKNGHFIHASTSNGVIVSRLDEAYYERCWMQGGRVKGL